MSTWTQTAEAHNVENGQLRAIIFYSDRSWSRVTVYGPKAVADFVGNWEMPWGKSIVELKNARYLPKAISKNEGYVHDATEYGLKEGKVLLVSGIPD